MSGSASFLILILLLSLGIYVVLARWASGRLYDKGYPAWTGWVIALTGFIPTLILVSVLPSKREEQNRKIMVSAEMELARQNAGIPTAGYANQSPPVWAREAAPPEIQAMGSRYSQPTSAPGFVSPQWVPPSSVQPMAMPIQAAGQRLPAGATRCGGCEFLIPPARETCPNCGIPVN